MVRRVADKTLLQCSTRVVQFSAGCNKIGTHDDWGVMRNSLDVGDGRFSSRSKEQ